MRREVDILADLVETAHERIDHLERAVWVIGVVLSFTTLMTALLIWKS
jgi:hypothetical protein